MKKIIMAIIVCTTLCATIFAQNESDFKTDGKGKITKYEGWDTKIVIPSQINGVPITEIGEGVFRKMGITSVTLPTGIKLIGSEAFKGNKLTNISIPNGVTVDTSAFAENQLTSVTIGDEAYIKNSAFTNNQLTSVVTGKKVRIEGFAFSNNKLTKVSIGDNSIILGKPFIENPTMSINLGSNIYIDIDKDKEQKYFQFYEYEYMCNNRKAGTYNNLKENHPIKEEGDYEFLQTRYGSVIIDYKGNDVERIIIPQKLGGMPVKGIGSPYGNVSFANSLYAFSSKGIKRCKLPDGLIFICSGSFYNNRLTSITIPESVIYIGYGVFMSNKLTDITLPDNVISIGNSAFAFNNLSSVTIGANLDVSKSGFDYAFEKLYNINRSAGTYTLNNKEWIFSPITDLSTSPITNKISSSDFVIENGIITDYNGWDTTIVIPSQINGMPVTAIGNGVFQNMGITSVTFPTGIKLIGSEAFKGNKLTTISIPNGVTVDTSAFSENQLTSATIGDEAYIKNSAFTKNQLTSVVIGKKVRIDRFAFSNNKLTRVSIGDNSFIFGKPFSENPTLISINLGSNIYIDMDLDKEQKYFQFYEYEYMCNNRKTGTYNNSKQEDIPHKKEGDYSFYQTRYGSVITKYEGNEVARLIIPQKLGGMPVKGIDFAAFYYKGISRCQLPDGLIFICSSSFKSNRLTSITIPESVIYIGNYVFEQNKLTDITIPDNVLSIGVCAFTSNVLSSVTIGKSVLFIGVAAFIGDNRTYGGDNKNQITSVTIGNSVISIGSNSFYGNGLTSVNLPDSVTFIGEGAFARNKLTRITIGANIDVSNASFDSAFDKLYNINRSEGTYIFNNIDWRFSPTTDLSTGPITDISTDPTTNISTTPKTDLSNTPTTNISSSSDFVIENGTITAYKGKGGNIIIDNTVTSIGKGAFRKCTSITGITIGSGVKSIGESAFEGCTKLTTINVDIGNTAYISDNGVLYNKAKTTLIQYPAGKTGTMFTVPDSVTSIEYGAFSGCTNLTNITIPFVGGKLNRGTLTTHFGYIFGAPTAGLQSFIIPTSIKTVIITGGNSIDDYAFMDCTSLTNVTIPDSVKSIGASAFTRCENLKNIILGNNVTSIGNNAFSNSGITSITIPKSVTSIGESAFKECRNLIDVTIGNGVTRIGKLAFSGCDNLKSVTFQGKIDSKNLDINAFDGLGDLLNKYLAKGIGTYTRKNSESKTWTKK